MPAQPPPLTYVGFTTQEIEGVVSSQKTPMWCWAASIQTVLNHFQVEVTQEEIVRRTFGSDAQGNLPPFGANAEIITRNLNNWGVDRNGRQYRVRADVFRGSPASERIIGHLAMKKPIILGYGPDAHSGHIVVVTAVSYHVDPIGRPHIATIIVRDPFPDTYNIHTRGRREYLNGTLPAPVQWMWLVDVERN